MANEIAGFGGLNLFILISLSDLIVIWFGIFVKF
jgi:hypothetical protein